MPDTLELLPELTVEAMPLFANEAEYFDFRELFMQEVIPEQEKWLEARLKSEEGWVDPGWDKATQKPVATITLV